jgi:hypothetical protein
MKLMVLGITIALGLTVLSAPDAKAAAAAQPYDFNGDTYPELVVGAPGLRVGEVRGAGGVVVLPASAQGLSLREKVISQSTRDVPGASEAGDGFGAAVTSADFDRDGHADLAIGQPGEGAGDVRAVGAITVLYGSTQGLSGARSIRLSQPSGRSEYANFGASLTSGDLNGDGYGDLAVGSPGDGENRFGEDFSASGAVTVLFGGPRGIDSGRTQLLWGDRGDSFDSGFGGVLAVGDVDADGLSDLLVGSEGGGYIDGTGHPGSVSYCRGSTTRLANCRRLVHSRTYAGIADLALGNMSGTARPEILVGVPRPDNDDEEGGWVVILSLTGSDPVSAAQEVKLTQASVGVPGSAATFAEWGSSLGVADIDRDGYADLAVGAPGATASYNGRLTVIHGASTGWRATGNYIYTQDTRGIPGVAEPQDSFGSSVTLIDHDRDGRLDLTIGASGENNGSGAITTLRGTGRGFTTTGARTFGLASLDYTYPARAVFGHTLGRR